MFKLARQLGRLNLVGTGQYLKSGVGCMSCHSSDARALSWTNYNNVINKPRASDLKSSLGRLTSKPLFSEVNFSLFVPRCSMSTLEQMHRKGPPKKTRFNKQKTALDGCPQKKGIVLKVIIKKPKKPNSANRKCVRVKLSNDKHIIGYIPGEGHNLQEHNIVLIEGGRKQDLPGVKHTVVRGKYDCNHVVKRTT